MDSFESKFGASCVEGANCLRSSHSVAKGASKIVEDVGNAVMAVPGMAIDATKRKFSIIRVDLKDAL